jgi:hypothetical protein
LSEDLEVLKRELNGELAELSARLARSSRIKALEVLDCGLVLEGWASRAGALGGAWQAETAAQARVIGEAIRAGQSLTNATERLMRLIITASENLNQLVGDEEPFSSGEPGEWAPNS